MRKTLTVLLATTSLALAGAAYAADAEYKAETTIKKDEDGSYKKETNVSNKDASGKVATQVSVDKDVNNDGTSKKVTTVEKTNDPKGLFNKQTDKTKQTIRADGTVETKRTVNGDTVQDSKSHN